MDNTAGMQSAFEDRVGNHVFAPTSSMWGYLPQINEWGRLSVTWDVVRTGGDDHIPVFKATPHYYNQVLTEYAREGPSKKAAKEAAAKAMALSECC